MYKYWLEYRKEIDKENCYFLEEDFDLTAKTDRGARIQARKIIKEKKLEVDCCTLKFLNTNNGCSWYMYINI